MVSVWYCTVLPPLAVKISDLILAIACFGTYVYSIYVYIASSRLLELRKPELGW